MKKTTVFLWLLCCVALFAFVTVIGVTQSAHSLSLVSSLLIFVMTVYLFLRILKERRELSKKERVVENSARTIEKSLCAISDGVIILDKDGYVILANPTASKLLSLGAEGRISLEAQSPALRDLINRARSASHAVADIILEGTEYELSADAVISKGAVESIAILILRESEKEKSALIRREFTANVSHELKTPLHAISGYAELLKNGMVKDEDKDRFLSSIYSEAQRLVDLIDDTIKLSRLDEGATDMVCETLDLYALAEKNIALLETKASRTGVTLSLSGKSCFMEGIPQLLDGIIFNLVDNAIKYNRENGSVSVEIKDNEKNITLNVCDTGIGIPEEYRERVFERFYRVDKSHSKEVGGTGLGLSIVKHAAKLHQAHIELYSVEGGGTSVSVIFPKHKN